MTKTILETEIQLQVLKYLKYIGAIAKKTKTTGITGYGKDPYLFVGFPDITCFWEHKLYFIEVKTKIGKLSPDQKKFQKLCKESNTPYILVRSVEDIIKVIAP